MPETKRTDAGAPRRRFTRYPVYKDSGVEWLGEIPAHWDPLKLKRICTFAYGDSLASEARVDGDVEVYGSNGPVGSHERSNTLAPCLVIGRKGSFGKVNFSPRPVFAIDTTFFVDRRFTRVDIRWLYYVLTNMRLDSVTKDSAIPGLDREDAYVRGVCLCSPDEQRAIAAFLDRETARIDALVAKEERLIELLQEKRTTLITRAITKGLDPNGPMKDSGVEWLGEIPAHWEVKSLKRISRRVGVGIAEAATHAYADEGVPIIRSTNVRANQVLAHDLLRIERSFAEKHRSKYLFAGDLVTVRTGVPGTTAVVPDELDRSQCFTMLISTPQKGHVSAFLSYFLNSTSAQVYFELEGWGTAQTNISVPILQRIPIPVPSEDQQKAIVAYIESEIARIDGLLARVQEAIDRLEEFRTALISAAVTGKIDVLEEASRIAGTAPPC